MTACAHCQTEPLLRIELPWPDSRLNPNQSKGRHWSSTSGLRAMAKTAAWMLTRQAMIENRGFVAPEALAVSITFIQPDARRRDRDNLLAALKPSLDGIAQGLEVDDSQFDPITIRREFGKKPGAVIVEVSYVPQ